MSIGGSSSAGPRSAGVRSEIMGSLAQNRNDRDDTQMDKAAKNNY